MVHRCLSPQDGFEGGGTYFPAASGDVDGILLRPTPGFCLVHDGKQTRNACMAPLHQSAARCCPAYWRGGVGRYGGDVGR